MNMQVNTAVRASIIDKKCMYVHKTHRRVAVWEPLDYVISLQAAFILFNEKADFFWDEIQIT
jgi:hypothetical protein